MLRQCWLVCFLSLAFCTGLFAPRGCGKIEGSSSTIRWAFVQHSSDKYSWQCPFGLQPCFFCQAIEDVQYPSMFRLGEKSVVMSSNGKLLAGFETINHESSTSLKSLRVWNTDEILSNKRDFSRVKGKCCRFSRRFFPKNPCQLENITLRFLEEVKEKTIIYGTQQEWCGDNTWKLRLTAGKHSHENNLFEHELLLDFPCQAEMGDKRFLIEDGIEYHYVLFDGTIRVVLKRQDNFFVVSVDDGFKITEKDIPFCTQEVIVSLRRDNLGGHAHPNACMTICCMMPTHEESSVVNVCLVTVCIQAPGKEDVYKLDGEFLGRPEATCCAPKPCTKNGRVGYDKALELCELLERRQGCLPDHFLRMTLAENWYSDYNNKITKNFCREFPCKISALRGLFTLTHPKGSQSIKQDFVLSFDQCDVVNAQSDDTLSISAASSSRQNMDTKVGSNPHSLSLTESCGSCDTSSCLSGYTERSFVSSDWRSTSSRASSAPVRQTLSVSSLGSASPYSTGTSNSSDFMTTASLPLNPLPLDDLLEDDAEVFFPAEQQICLCPSHWGVSLEYISKLIAVRYDLDELWQNAEAFFAALGIRGMPYYEECYYNLKSSLKECEKHWGGSATDKKLQFNFVAELNRVLLAFDTQQIVTCVLDT